MGVQIAVRLADQELERLDAAIARGTFPNRAAAVRAGLHRLLQEEREKQIDAAYRRAYCTDRDDDGVGDAGLVLGGALVARDELVAGDPGAVAGDPNA